jgi:hypothetical protein
MQHYLCVGETPMVTRPKARTAYLGTTDHVGRDVLVRALERSSPEVSVKTLPGIARLGRWDTCPYVGSGGFYSPGPSG